MAQPIGLPASRSGDPGGQFGNAGRNIARGPGYTNVDASLVRTFALSGRSQVQFRWEVFNVFDHVNLGLPVADLNSPNFGRIFFRGTTAADAVRSESALLAHGVDVFEARVSRGRNARERNRCR